MEWEPAENYLNIKNMCCNVKCKKKLQEVNTLSIKLQCILH